MWHLTMKITWFTHKQPSQSHSVSTQLDHNQGEAVEAGMCDIVTCTLLDDFLNLADVDIGVAPDQAPDPPVPDSTASADLTWMGMDPHISDSEEPDRLYESSESDSSSCSDLDQD